MEQIEKIVILIGDSQYSKLICFLLKKKETKIIIQEEFIKKINIKIKKNMIFRIFGKYLIRYKIKKKYRNIKISFIGSDHDTLGNILLGVRNNFELIEDGTENYNELNFIKESNIKLFLRKVLNFNRSFGQDHNVKKIYLTGIAPIPKEIAHKVEVINLKKLWNKKSLEEQNEILNIFSFDLNIKENIKGRDIILFTQPLSEDNILTEEEKIGIYSRIIKKYPKERLIIKTHPREKTNYKDLFKEYLVLDNPFPFEILNLLDIEFKKAITIFSTAALGLGNEIEVDFYGTEVHPNILEKFGSCDNIMKRNCFLEEE